MKDKKLFTPPLSVGCVGGVMRLFIMELAKNKGIELEEKKLSINDIELADEVFLTNALQGIKWVERFKESEFKNDFINELNELFLEKIML